MLLHNALSTAEKHSPCCRKHSMTFQSPFMQDILRSPAKGLHRIPVTLFSLWLWESMATRNRSEAGTDPAAPRMSRMLLQTKCCSLPLWRHDRIKIISFISLNVLVTLTQCGGHATVICKIKSMGISNVNSYCPSVFCFHS
uniref:Uncharacterized protein n=1 Tax=Trypanosoma congolense (strain IL3000) TaxID=1068625 RepID=G0USU5_TRYCI|nr:hypothetical protein, unlikely [Trypanosoma congolense IL3000]